MSKKPLISVVMSVYNGEKYLRESIDSILNQTFKDFEFIIIDDGSTDKTKAIIQSCKDKRIVLISRENKGLVASLNEGIEIARGQFIARQDADDISTPNRLKEQLTALNNNPDLGLVCSDIDEIDLNGVTINRYTIYDTFPDGALELALGWVNPIAHGTVLMKKDVFIKAGCYSESAWPAEDYDLWLRIARFSRLGKLSAKHYKYRVNDEGISFSNTNQQVAQSQIIQAALLDNPIKLRHGKYLYRTPLEKIRGIYSLVRKGKIITAIKHVFRGRLSGRNQVAGGAKNVLHISIAESIGGGEETVRNVFSSLGAEFKFSLLAPRSLNEQLNLRNPTYNLPLRVQVNGALARKTPLLRQIIYRILIWLSIPASSYDIVHIHQFDKDLIGALPKNSKKILSAHTRYIFGREFEPIAKKSLSALNIIIAVSRATMQDLQSLGLDKKILCMVSNGIDGSNLLKLDQKRERRDIVWVGRLVREDKNPDLFIDIAQEAYRRDLKLKFRVYGDGDYRHSLESRVVKSGLKNIEFAGFVENKNLIFQYSYVTCITSESEAMPLTALESMASGTPVVSTDVGDLRLMLQDSKAGLIAEPSAESFIDAIQEIVNKYDDYSVKARSVFSSTYTLDHMTNQISRIYIRGDV